MSDMGKYKYKIKHFLVHFNEKLKIILVNHLLMMR